MINYIIIFVIGAGLFLAIRKLIKDKKNNKGCGGGCQGCQNSNCSLYKDEKD